MAAVSASAVTLLCEAFFCLTAKGIMPVLRIWPALARGRISIETTVFLSAGPAPGLSAPLAHVEFVLVIEATGKDIVTCGVFQRPAAAPRTLFGVCGTRLWHLPFRRKDFSIEKRRMIIATLAIGCKQEIVLALVGGVFVMEAMSVIIQVISFKKRGKRVFRMAPIHHHFELGGWHENQVIVRFWMLSLLFAMLGLATLKLR